MSAWEKINLTNWDWGLIGTLVAAFVGSVIVVGLIIWGCFALDQQSENDFRHQCAAKDPRAYSVITGNESDCLIPYHGGIKRVIHDN